MKPARTEHIEIKMELDKAAYDRHRKAVEDFSPHLQVSEGDTLKLTYNFYCDYHGDIVKKLTAVKEFCSDPAIVHKASCSELEEGRVLVYEVLKKLDEVIQLVREPDDPFPWRRRPLEKESEPKRRTWREWWRGE
ncbi:MAG: hypothetical protein ACYTFQ_31100 [Planctomycetota bacterium]|jgi:hypothetical protein